MMPVLFCGDTDRHGDCHPRPFSLLIFWVIFFTTPTLELACFSRNQERHVQSQEFSIFHVDSGKKIAKVEGVVTLFCDTMPGEMWANVSSPQKGNEWQTTVQLCEQMYFTGITYRSMGESLQEQKWFKENCITKATSHPRMGHSSQELENWNTLYNL